MFAAANLVDDMWLTIKFGIGNKRNIQKSWFSKVINRVKKIFNRDDFAENISSLKIRGKMFDSKYVEEINLIERLLVSKKTVLKMDEKSRCVDSEDMYEKILESYESLYEELQQYIKPE
jgi:hypothetical protein